MKVHRWKKTIIAFAAATSLALAIGAAPSQAATRVESTKVSACLSASDLSKLPLTSRHLTEHEKCNLAVVLRAYHDGEGTSLDPRGSGICSQRTACSTASGTNRARRACAARS